MKTKHEDKSFILERGLLVAYCWFAMTGERAPVGYCRGDGESSSEASLRQARGESKRGRVKGFWETERQKNEFIVGAESKNLA